MKWRKIAYLNWQSVTTAALGIAFVTMTSVSINVENKLQVCQFALTAATSARDGFAQMVLIRMEPEDKRQLTQKEINLSKQKSFRYWFKANEMVNQYQDCYMKTFESNFLTTWYQIFTNIIGVVFGIFLGALFTRDKILKAKNG